MSSRYAATRAHGPLPLKVYSSPIGRRRRSSTPARIADTTSPPNPRSRIIIAPYQRRTHLTPSTCSAHLYVDETYPLPTRPPYAHNRPSTTSPFPLRFRPTTQTPARQARSPTTSQTLCMHTRLRHRTQDNTVRRHADDTARKIKILALASRRSPDGSSESGTRPPDPQRTRDRVDLRTHPPRDKPAAATAATTVLPFPARCCPPVARATRPGSRVRGTRPAVRPRDGAHVASASPQRRYRRARSIRTGANNNV
jgi:hypothetical protein